MKDCYWCGNDSVKKCTKCHIHACDKHSKEMFDTQLDICYNTNACQVFIEDLIQTYHYKLRLAHKSLESFYKEAEKKYEKKEKALMDKKTKSNRAEHERREENREANEEYEATREVRSKAASPRVTPPVQDKIDPNDPAEALKSAKI
jgi:hypothetical protein